MVKVGYFPCTQDPPKGEKISQVLNEAVVEAQVAEECGYDSVLFSEHHQQADCYIPNVILMAGMVGMKTERIKVGTCVVLIPLQHPVHVAEDSAIVDQLLKGRMILSLGVGYQEVDFNAFGVPISERAGRSEEGIDIIRKAWTGERVTYEGKYYKLNNVLVTPKPYQKDMPIWMAAWTKPGLKRVGRMADAWITSPLESVGVIKSFADIYRSEAQKHRRKPYVVLMRDVWVAESWEAARRESEPLMYTHRFYFRNNGYAMDDVLRKVKSEQEWTFDVAAPNRLIAGSPKDCLDQLKMWKREVNFDYLVLRMRHPGGPDHKRVVEAIRTFGEKVIPQL